MTATEFEKLTREEQEAWVMRPMEPEAGSPAEAMRCPRCGNMPDCFDGLPNQVLTADPQVVYYDCAGCKTRLVEDHGRVRRA